MKTFATCLLVVLLSSLGRAQSVDSTIQLGDRFEGSIDSALDVDVLEFKGLAGEKVSVTVGPAKKSKLIPRVALFLEDGDGGPALMIASNEPIKGKKAKLKQIVLPETGSYTLAVTGVDGATGGYKLISKSKIDKTLKKPAAAPAPDLDPDSLRVKLAVKAGSFLNATVKPGKKSPAVPGMPVLRDPIGNPVDLTPYMKQKGTKTLLKKVPLTMFGVYELDVENDGPAGDLIVVAKVLTPKFKKTTFFEYNFGGGLIITPDVLYVGDIVELVVTIALGDGATDPDDVSLVKIVDGQEVLVSELFDDGILANNGDEIEADGIFSARFFLTPMPGDEGLEQYLVRVGRLGKAPDVLSEAVSVLISEHLSDDEIDTIMALQTDFQADIDQAVIDGMLPAVLAQVEADLLADPAVAEVGYSDDGRGLWVLYSCGVSGLLYTWEDGTKGGGPASSQLAPPGGVGGRVAGLQDDAEDVGLSGVAGRSVDDPPYDAFASSLTTLTSSTPLAQAILDWQGLPEGGAIAGSTKNLVRSNKVKAIAAQFFDWGANDDIPVMAQTLIDDDCFEVDYIKYNSKGSGSVEDFKNLADYGMVLISSHGDSFYQFLSKPWKAIFGFAGASSQVVVHSNMGVTKALTKLYENDLRKGRMVFWYGNYGMTPSFFKTYSGKMPNSIIYTSICRGAFNATLANAFFATGAAAFLSYSDYVAVSFCKANGPPLLNKLLMAGNTLDDSFTPGQVEVDNDPAAFLLFGDKTVQLGAKELHNGGFEDGAVVWEGAGDARAVPALAGYSPTEGKLMGIISTGLGFTTTSGSFSQTLCLPDDAETMIFDWIFFSEEFLEFCGSIFQDTFDVTITDLDGGGGTTLLFKTFVDDLCGPPNGNGDYVNHNLFPVSASFDQGDVWTTGWQSKAVSIPPALAGKRVRIDFMAGDVGDSIYDTAIGIDQIEIIMSGNP